MANIMDYLDWRGDLPLTVSPFNEVDGLILAELSFINFEGIVPPPELGRGVPLRDAAGTYFARHNGQEIDMGVLVPGRIPDLMCRMAHSVRFGGMLLNGYCELMDDAREQQFAALTVELGDGSIYLSYRGTDDTIVGWKEDLNMGYLEVIPSQTRALEYLGRMTRQYPDARLRIGGHSKGGNLSVYAAVKAPAAVQDRIVQVYNNDGPGFAKPLVGTPEHTRVADRILTVVPQSSVVGQLLEQEQNVESARSPHSVHAWSGSFWSMNRMWRSCARTPRGCCSTTAFPGRSWAIISSISTASPARERSSTKRSSRGRDRSAPNSARRLPTRSTRCSPPQARKRSPTSTATSSKAR